MADPLIGLNGQNTVNVVGGPTLTASGIGVAGADLANTPGTDLALGGATRGDLAAVKATFDKVIRWRNRWEPMYRSFATTGPASVAPSLPKTERQAPRTALAARANRLAPPPSSTGTSA